MTLCCESMRQSEDRIVGGSPHPRQILNIGVAHDAHLLANGGDVTLLRPYKDKPNWAEAGKGKAGKAAWVGVGWGAEWSAAFASGDYHAS